MVVMLVAARSWLPKWVYETLHTIGLLTLIIPLYFYFAFLFHFNPVFLDWPSAVPAHHFYTSSSA